MKNKKDLIAVLGIALLLVVTYAIPIIVTGFEDKHLQSEAKYFEIEEINLNSDEVNWERKLVEIQKILADDIVVQGDDIIVQESQADKPQNQKDVEQKIVEFLGALNGETKKEFQKLSTKRVALADSEMGKVYSFWKCYALDESKHEYIFWLDDESEKVLAFEIPFDTVALDAEKFYLMVERLREYYGFEGVELIGKANAFLREEYSETALRFLGETEEEEMMLMLYKTGNVISFNKYPGDVAVYDMVSKSN